MHELLFIAFGWFVGGFINGIAGFGAAMVAVPIIAPFIDLSLVVPSSVLLVFTLNFQVCWTFRHHILLRYVKGILIGAIPGVLLSMLILPSVPESVLKVGMGCFIATYALWNLVFGKATGSGGIHPAWGYLTGILSSSLGMAFGFNGPPLAAYAAHCGCNAKSVKGIIGAGFIVTGVCIVGAKAVSGQINDAVLMIYLTSTPAVILGSKLGISCSSHMSERAFKKVLLCALAVMGVWLIFPWD